MGDSFHHVGVLVPNMAEAIEWFGEVLGVEIGTPEEMITHGRIDPGEFGDDEQHEGRSHLAWSKAGPPYYELIEAKGNGLHSLERHGPGLHHVGMYVRDVDAEISRLERLGIGLLGRVVAPDGRTMACWSERAPATGLSVEYIDERLLPLTQAWIESGRRPRLDGVVR
jgi:catechol 2,3-dioxygenase-like lactoylglutathione lyase family enzyme